MGIDTSIYQNALRPVKSVQDYDNEYMQGQQNKLMLGLQQQKADEYTRGIADSNQLREVVKGFGADTDANHQKLLGAGRLTEANAYAKSATEQKRAELEATKTKLETGLKQFETMAQVMSGVRDQASYDQARQQAIQILGPEAAASIPPVYDPAQIEQGKLRAMSIKDQMANHWKDIEAKLAAEKFGEDKRHARVGEANSAGQLAVSQGNLGLSRDRLAYDKSQPKGVITQTDQGPMLVDPRTGQAQPVTAGGKPVQTAKAPTEFQGKSAAFGARAEQAAKIIDQIGDKYSPAAINAKQAVGNTWLVGGALEAATNKMALSDNDQKAEQAQRDFVNAVLRQESGAAIGPSEFDNAKKQYFPQPGDGAAIKAQKKRNRDLAVQGLVSNAGRAAFSAPADGAAPAGQHSPEIESLLEKYK